MDTWYNSIQPVTELLKMHKLTVIRISIFLHQVQGDNIINEKKNIFIMYSYFINFT